MIGGNLVKQNSRLDGDPGAIRTHDLQIRNLAEAVDSTHIRSGTTGSAAANRLLRAPAFCRRVSTSHQPPTRAILALVALLALTGCEKTEPQFHEGQIVRFKLVDITGMVSDVQCAGLPCQWEYSIRLSTDQLTVVYDVREFEIEAVGAGDRP